MKKIIVALLIILAMFCSAQAFAVESNDIRVVLNGKEVNFEAKPLLINDRTMIPLRSVFEEIGGQVEWLEIPSSKIENNQLISYKRQSVFVTACGHRIRLDIGSKVATVDFDENVQIDAPPVLINSRTYIPLRFIAESIGADVKWDRASSTVTINTPVPDYSQKVYNEFPQVPNFQQIFGWPPVVDPADTGNDVTSFTYFIERKAQIEMIEKYELLLKEYGFKRVDTVTATSYFTNGQLVVGIGVDIDFLWITIAPA